MQHTPVDYAHQDDYYMFGFVESGECDIHIDFNSYSLTAHCAALVLPGQVHSFVQATGLNAYILMIDSAFIEENSKRIQQIEHETKDLLMENQKLRGDIKVVIIIGSKLKWDSEKNFLEHNEDFVTAFLIYHLFHYAFGIPYENILSSSRTLHY